MGNEGALHKTNRAGISSDDLTSVQRDSVNNVEDAEKKDISVIPRLLRGGGTAAIVGGALHSGYNFIFGSKFFADIVTHTTKTVEYSATCPLSAPLGQWNVFSIGAPSGSGHMKLLETLASYNQSAGQGYFYLGNYVKGGEISNWISFKLNTPVTVQLAQKVNAVPNTYTVDITSSGSGSSQVLISHVSYYAQVVVNHFAAASTWFYPWNDKIGIAAMLAGIGMVTAAWAWGKPSANKKHKPQQEIRKHE